MSTFRKKILIAHVVVFLLFLGLMFPFASTTMKRIVMGAMQLRADELIAKIQAAPSEEALARRLKNQKHLTFFRVTVISQERFILYDSHTKLMLGPRFSQEYIIDHPDVVDAFDKGTGYSENYSDLLGQKFAYLSKSFAFQDSTYVLRIAFPHQYLEEISNSFEIGFLTLCTLVLLAFSIMSWAVIHKLTGPIQQITDAIKPYHQGAADEIPEIAIQSTDPKDDFVGLAQTLNSLSKRVKGQIDSLKQERNERAAILDALSEGVIAVDASLIITYINPRAQDLLSAKAEEFMGSKFVVTKLPLCQDLLLKCLEQRKVQSDTLEMQKGRKRLFLDAVALPSGPHGGAILVLHDISAESKMLEMRKDFIANASHELKTPITIVKGFAEALHDNPELSKEIAHEITGKMIRNCDRMNSLVKDLLALADIENLPASSMAKIDLLDLATECKELLVEHHPSTLIFLSTDEAGKYLVTADKGLLRQAIMNLLENATRYSPQPAQITIELKSMEDMVQLEVADKGIGIPEKDLEHIFERFYTVDKSKSQKRGGSGLGLAIVETIVHKHYGSVRASSQVGEGSTFVITLPHA